MEHPASRPSGRFAIGVRSPSSQVSTGERDESEEKQIIGQKSKLIQPLLFSPSIQLLCPCATRWWGGDEKRFTWPRGWPRGCDLWPESYH